MSVILVEIMEGMFTWEHGRLAYLRAKVERERLIMYEINKVKYLQ